MDLPKKHSRNNQDIFLVLLKNLKIEDAIERFIGENIKINYNNKERFIPKTTWVNYLRKTILSKFTEVIQFNVEKVSSQGEVSTFKIFMICKKLNGTLDFTEICLNNNWEDSHINKIQYKLINH